jgi:ribose transport system substrate-binding protein
MKRVGFFVVLLILIVGMGAFAGGGRQQAVEGEQRVAILMTPLTNPFHRTMWRMIQEEIEAARITHPHVRFTVYHNADTEIQINNAEIILAGNYDGVLISTFDGALMAEPTARIHRTGTRVVVINRMLETQEWDDFVSGDNVQGGRNVARYMGNFLGGQGNIYIVGMQLGTPIARDRSSGFEEVMRTEFPNIRILGTSEGEHNITAGFQAMQNILAAHPHIDAVYSHDPFSAMGQEQAIANAGRTDIRIIMACAPDRDMARHMMANPNTLIRGNFNYPPMMAAEGVRTLLRILDGQVPGRDFPREYLMEAELLMAEDAARWEMLVPDPDA